MSLSVRLGAVAALLVAGTAEAGQLVCKDKIIDTGTTAAELLAACGEPRRDLALRTPQPQAHDLRDPARRQSGRGQEQVIEMGTFLISL
jgi:Protein of unknown function (DUF2845)